MLDEFLGNNTRINQPKIDRWHAGSGEVVSIKSLDPRLKSYQDPANFERRLNRYASLVNGYGGEGRKKYTMIDRADIRNRKLHLVLASGGLNNNQLKVLNSLRYDWAQRGIDLKVSYIYRG
ncbi:MAG TPA: hypothetical protein DEA96_05280 [Leptospiraceae bacterium]|nr:hypothetical protein [Spirochaetaceae bacterium]HBS04354.1 hypothetical protein [Leptospiraceae bacterium]